MAKKLKLEPKPRSEEIIETVDLSSEMRDSFINYAIASISDRALPDVLTGLKPVHTRLLFDMKKLGLTSDKKTSKSQRITGDVMGKYHPHGESYGSLVVMSRPFEFWMPYVHIEGNSDDLIGNNAAAPRYTEAKFTIFGDAITKDISDKLVPYEPNYDNTETMPIVLPATFPALLINGTKYGIAVGFATNIAPHNPIEALNLTIAYLQNPHMSLEDMMAIMPGPDFPTGGVLVGDPKTYYETGRGSFKNKGAIEIVDKKTLAIKQVPYMMGHAIKNYVETVIQKITDQKLKGIKKIEDYTTGENNESQIEITIDPKVITPERAIALLEKNTDFSQTYNPIWLALDDLTPHTYTLREYMESYTKFQHRLTINRFKIELTKAESRLEIVEGLLTLKDPKRLDAILHLARTSKNKEAFEISLKDKFNYTDAQAANISNTPIHRLNNVNFDNLEAEQKDLLNKIKWAHRLIEQKDVRIKYMVRELNRLLDSIKDDPYYQRRTKLRLKDNTKTYKEELLVEDVTVTINEYGYVKLYDRLKNQDDATLTYLDTKDDDILCAFGESGMMYQLPIKKLTKYQARDKSRGELADALFELVPNDEIILWTTKSVLDSETTHMIMVSQKGLAKRFNTKGTKLVTSTIRKQTIAYKSKFEDDSLFYAKLINIEELTNLEILVTRDDTVKRMALENVKFQGSASGAGAQTFYNKKTGENISSVHILSEPTRIQNLDFGDFDSQEQPFLKETQAFKKINHILIDKSSTEPVISGIIEPSTNKEGNSNELNSSPQTEYPDGL